jgi:hypothetical protein
MSDVSVPIYSNNIGKVGIGTENPLEILHVQGNITASKITASFLNGTLFGLSTLAISASWSSQSFSSVSSSFVLGNVTGTASWAGNSIVSSTSTYSSQSQFSISSSVASSSVSSSHVVGTHIGNTIGTSSWSGNSIVSATTVYASQSQFAVSSSYSSASLRTDSTFIQTTASNQTAYISFVLNTGSYNNNFVTTSLIINPAVGGITANSFTGSVRGNLTGTASWAGNSIVSSTSLYSSQSQFSISSSFASSSISASYARSSSYVSLSGTTNYLPKWNNNQLTSTSEYFDNGINPILQESLYITSSLAPYGIQILSYQSSAWARSISIGNIISAGSQSFGVIGVKGQPTFSEYIYFNPNVTGSDMAQPFNTYDSSYTIKFNKDMSIQGISGSTFLMLAPYGNSWISGSIVGIGTVTPRTVLHVFGPVSASAFGTGSFHGLHIGNVVGSASYASSSFTSISSSYSLSSSYALSSSFSFRSISASYASISATASYISGGYNSSAETASYAFFSELARTASYISGGKNTSVETASYAFFSELSRTASYVTLTGTNNYYPKWNNNSLTPTSSIFDDGTTVGIGTSSFHTSSYKLYNNGNFFNNGYIIPGTNNTSLGQLHVQPLDIISTINNSIHDVFKFNPPNLQELSSSAGLVTQSINKDLFMGEVFGNETTITGSALFYRFTWNGMPYSYFNGIYNAFSTNGNPGFRILIEAQTGSTWIGIATSSLISGWPDKSYFRYYWDNQTYVSGTIEQKRNIRLTYLPVWGTDTNKILGITLYNIRYMVGYPFSDSTNREYTWDYEKSVTFANNVSASKFSGSFIGLHTGNTIGTSSWSSNSLTASFIGSGSNNYFPKWINNTLSTASNVIDNGTFVGVGTTNPQGFLHVAANSVYSDINVILGLFSKTTGNAFGSSILRIARLSTDTHTGSGVSTYTDLEQNSGGSGPFRFGTTFNDTVIVNSQGNQNGLFGSIKFVTSSSVRMTIAGGTGAGKVGIATSIPSASFDVSSGDQTNGTILIGAGVNSNTRTNSSRKVGSITGFPYTFSTKYLSLISYDQLLTTTTQSIVAIGGASGSNFSSPTRIEFYTTSSLNDPGLVRMILDETGSLGIGTTMAVAKLHVSASTGFGANIDCGGGGNSSTYALSVNKLGTSYLHIRGDGYVGIGAAPSTNGWVQITSVDTSTPHFSLTNGVTNNNTSNTYTFKGWWGVRFNSPSFNGGSSETYYIPIYS